MDCCLLAVVVVGVCFRIRLERPSEADASRGIAARSG